MIITDLFESRPPVRRRWRLRDGRIETKVVRDAPEAPRPRTKLEPKDG